MPWCMADMYLWFRAEVHNFFRKSRNHFKILASEGWHEVKFCMDDTQISGIITQNLVAQVVWPGTMISEPRGHRTLLLPPAWQYLENVGSMFLWNFSTHLY